MLYLGLSFNSTKQSRSRQADSSRASYETPPLFPLFTKAEGLLPCPQEPSHSGVLRIYFNIILPSISRFTWWFFSTRFAIRNLDVFLFSPLPPVHATYPLHIILLGLIARIISGKELWSASLCSFLQSPVSTLSVKDQVSRADKTGKIIVRGKANMRSFLTFCCQCTKIEIIKNLFFSEALSPLKSSSSSFLLSLRQFRLFILFLYLKANFVCPSYSRFAPLCRLQGFAW